MKIAIGQVNLTIGDIKNNTNNLILQVKNAINAGAKLIIFPELSDCVKGAKDLLKIKEYIKNALTVKEELNKYSDKIAIIMGGIEQKESKLYNAAFLLNNGQIEKIATENNISYENQKYFSSEKFNKKIKIKDTEFSTIIGEDQITTSENEWIIRLNSKPFTKNAILKGEKNQNTILVNHIGLAQDLIYAEGSAIINKKGEILACAPDFTEHLLIFDTEKTPDTIKKEKTKEEQIFKALSFGFKEFCRINKFQKALIGLSGGIDSALSAVIMCDAIGPQNVLGITMPSKYSTEGSWKDSYDLANNLKMECKTQPIKPLFDTFINDIQGKSYLDLAEENLQARLRGNILMSVSNRENRVLVSTGNKSEASVGYCTLYGDTCGGINLICDLFKQEVYSLSRWINREKEIIPENTITKAPSAELRPDQKDQDSLPDYKILDEILARYIEEEESVESISKDFDKKLVCEIINKLNIMEFKRAQFTQTLKISKKALSDRQYPTINAFRYN